MGLFVFQNQACIGIGAARHEATTTATTKRTLDIRNGNVVEYLQTVTIVGTIFIPHWSAVLFVLPLISILYVDLLGVLQFAGVAINPVSYISVRYMAYTQYSTMLTPNSKMSDTIIEFAYI